MQPLSEGRKATFLRVLAETGIFVWAARSASPYARNEKGCASTFRTAMKADPLFAAAVAEAREEADAKIERECFRRAVEGVKTPCFQKGTQATTVDGEPAFITTYSDRLMERLLEARMPERWAQQKHHKHSGTIHHQPVGILEIGTTDLHALDKEQRAQLQGILVTIREARAGETPALTHQPGKVIDADFETVDGEPEPVEAKRYQRKPFDKSESLAAYREFAEGEGDTLAEIEAIDAARNGGGNDRG